MFTFDTTNLEQHIAYVAASAIDMATGTRYGRLLWRAADAVLEFDGATVNAQLVEIAARRAGWVCSERLDCGTCIAWRMQAAPMEDADGEQMMLLAA